jgi:LacI family transcriptional regulator
MNGRTTIHDIARELNISSSTVSRALLDSPKISTSVKQTVAETAKRLNYRKNNVAVGFRRGKANTIGVVIPRIDRYFFAQAVSAIEAAATKAGYNVLICQTNEELRLEKTVIDVLCNGTVDGLLVSVAAEKNDYSHLKKAEQCGIPVVFFDRCPPHAQHKVVIDDYQAAHMAMEHLLAQGLQRIVHFSGYLHLKIWDDRCRGYLDAMKAYGIKVPHKWVFENVLNEQAGADAAKQMMQSRSVPEAIFSASDYAALGACSYFKSKGISVPQDVAIVGFANEAFTAHIEPAMTTIDQHPAEMGTAAVQLMIALLKEKPIPAMKIITPSLIVRKSSIVKNQLKDIICIKK